MRARSRALVVGVVTGALVLTGCADDDVDLIDDGVSIGVRDGDVDLEDADLIEDGDLEDVDRGVLLLDEEDPDQVVYIAEVETQCYADASEERPDVLPQMRVDLTGEGSLVVSYDVDTDQLLDVDLVTEPDAPAIAWDAAGAAAWDVRDGVLIGEATVDGVDPDGAPSHVLRFAIDWHDDVDECLDVQEPVTELAGEASWLEVPGARMDAVEVCEEPGDDGRVTTMTLEDGSILVVTAADAETVSAELTLASGETRDVELVDLTGVADEDGDITGTFTFADPGSGESVEATFRIDREAAGNCEPA